MNDIEIELNPKVCQSGLDSELMKELKSSADEAMIVDRSEARRLLAVVAAQNVQSEHNDVLTTALAPSTSSHVYKLQVEGTETIAVLSEIPPRPVLSSNQTSSVLFFDVQRQRRWRHQAVVPAAARHHGDAAATVSLDAAAPSSPSPATTAVPRRRRGRGRGGGRLLELLLVDLALLCSPVLEPDLHLDGRSVLLVLWCSG